MHDADDNEKPNALKKTIRAESPNEKHFTGLA